MPQKRTDKNGKTRWIGRYRDHRQKEHSKTFTTRREAKQWEDEARDLLRKGLHISESDKKITVRQYAEAWADHAVKPETKATRKGLLVSLGWLGDYRLCDVKASDILRWRKELEAGRSWLPAPKAGGVDQRALSPSTAGNVTGQLMSVLKLAMEDGVIHKLPVVKVSKQAKPKVIHPQDVLTVEDVQTLATAAITPVGRYKPRPWLRTMILISAGSGLRLAEVCGIRKQDFDATNRVLHVRGQIGKDRAFVPPKSATSVRDIPIPAWVVMELQGYMARFPNESEFVFWREGYAGGDGGPHTRDSVSHGMRAMVNCHDGARDCTFHDLRHFYASALIHAGVSVSGVQHALGHASASTTLDLYVHLWPGADDVIRGAVGGLGILAGKMRAFDEKTPNQTIKTAG
ncbi:site-specific integrase [Corynebacterium diphtheriae]|nr:site-specific integrase [Corynebacterium diphtheriae]